MLQTKTNSFHYWHIWSGYKSPQASLYFHMTFAPIPYKPHQHGFANVIFTQALLITTSDIRQGSSTATLNSVWEQTAQRGSFPPHLLLQSFSLPTAPPLCLWMQLNFVQSDLSRTGAECKGGEGWAGLSAPPTGRAVIHGLESGLFLSFHLQKLWSSFTRRHHCYLTDSGQYWIPPWPGFSVDEGPLCVICTIC